MKEWKNIIFIITLSGVVVICWHLLLWNYWSNWNQMWQEFLFCWPHLSPENVILVPIWSSTWGPDTITWYIQPSLLPHQNPPLTDNNGLTIYNDGHDPNYLPFQRHGKILLWLLIIWFQPKDYNKLTNTNNIS
jgi:hypothetical protein